MYKTVFVDWDGTLSSSRFWGRWREDPSQQFKYDLVQEVLFQNARDLLRDWMRGYRSVAFAVDYVANASGLPYDELMDELQYSCEHMQFADVGVVDMVQYIRAKGITVVIATDNMDTFRQWTMPALKINDLFDGVLTSDAQGSLKAQSSKDGTSTFFHHYLIQNGLKSGETVLIDDNINNKVVENFGIDFLHATSENSLEEHLSRLA